MVLLGHMVNVIARDLFKFHATTTRRNWGERFCEKKEYVTVVVAPCGGDVRVIKINVA